MRQLLKKNWFTALLAAAAMTLSAAVAARLLLRHISLFLSFDEQFRVIFAQIRDASLATPTAILMAVAFPAAWGLGKLGKGSAWRILLWGLLWLLLLILTFALTRVNGIRFGDVLISLLDILRKGGLDG